MKFCFHKWSNWSAPFNSTITRSRGSFGGTSVDDVVVQERTCNKCGKIQAVVLRDGKINDMNRESHD